MWRVSRRPDFVALLKLLSFTVVLFLFCYLLSLLCYVWTTLHYFIHSSIFRSAYPHWSRGWAVTHRWLWSSVNRGEHAGKQTFTLTFTPVENFESSITVWCISLLCERKRKKKPMQAQRKEVNLKQDGRSADSKPQPQKSDTDVLIHLPTCYFRNISVFVLVEVISFWNIWICTFLCFNFCLIGIGIDVTHYLSSFPLNP